MMNKVNEAVEHYYKTLKAYEGNARDIKKADKHMDGFTDMFREAVEPSYEVGEKHHATVSGGFLNKRWDMAYGNDGKYAGALELKSIVLSKMGKCFSNRVEEAIGVATDLRHVNSDIKLNYFLVIEDDVEDGKNKSNKLDKINSFCDYLETELKLYDNVCCIVLNDDKVTELYSGVEKFINKWSKNT